MEFVHCVLKESKYRDNGIIIIVQGTHQQNNDGIGLEDGRERK